MNLEIDENQEINESSSLVEINKSSKIKHVNKLLYKKLREQMEFYFSDSNLSKDRFINQEISKSEDGYDLQALAKAIKRSTFLELNEEHTKVKRCVPYVQPNQADVDKRTVYVERLPPHVDHELLKTIFSRCGHVSYVSLPRFQSTKQIKGFAFVEFQNKEGAKNAIKTLNDLGTNEESDDGDDDSVVGVFPKYNKQLAHLEEKLIKTETEEKKKRKLTKTNNDSIDTEPKNKERKLDENDENKKKKNRRRKNSVLKAKKMDKEIAEEATLLHLRVISKKEWLRLRKDYLEKQKSNLSELKAKLKSIKSSEVEENERPRAKKQRIEEPKFIVDDAYKNCIIKLTPKNALDEKTYDLFKLTRQQFKNEKLKEFDEQIAYVDINKNLNRIFVRCKNKVAAEDLKSKEEYLNDFNKDLLAGSEEYEYVSKISSNRDKKHEKKAKKENRGKDKLINKANIAIKNEIMKEVVTNSKIHITFDD